MRNREPVAVMPQSSGDPVADRRFAYAEALSGNGDYEGAADLLAQTTELVPAWIPVWMALAAAQERSGQVEAAIAALARARHLDPSDRFGASLHLARLTSTRPAGMAPDFVATLFDQYADRFERHLTEALAYRGPAIICEALERTGELPQQDGAVIDLGCGTGLMARALAGRVGAIDGLDLSPGMIAKARATGLYRQLRATELVAGLAEGAASAYRLAVAADVFAYFGELGPAFHAVARALHREGVFAFTTETWDGDGFRLGPAMRFAHAAPYVESILRAAGFETRLIEPVSTRLDAGQPVPGLVVVARRA